MRIYPDYPAHCAPAPHGCGQACRWTYPVTTWDKAVQRFVRVQLCARCTGDGDWPERAA